ncbi:MAG: zinc-binding alcohol dehydrogenase family protein [Candidatus Eremiobacteraeota bacterium]|nr:zinc-binding alcohol dehydrogenase family protein [Candidatus Eremiobacteraeota bacterium]
MLAAVVETFVEPPRYRDFAEPIAESGEVLVCVSHAAQSTLVKAQAAGKHYSVRAGLPFVAGADGVGRLEDGTRVYFLFARAPFGSMAQIAPVRSEFCIWLPQDLDDATAAAAGNAGMSSWVALTERARFVRGESVLINGATGVSGKLAVQVAKYLGAKNVIATGRNPNVLESLPALGADAVISLDTSAEKLIERLRREMRERDVSVVLDYLWGPPAEHLIEAIAGPGAAQTDAAVRFVQIGGSAGPTISLNAAALRSSKLELVGSGLGSVSFQKLVGAIELFFRAFVPAKFQIAIELTPLSDVDVAWNHDAPERRRVFRL